MLQRKLTAPPNEWSIIPLFVSEKQQEYKGAFPEKKYSTVQGAFKFNSMKQAFCFALPIDYCTEQITATGPPCRKSLIIFAFEGAYLPLAFVILIVLLSHSLYVF